MDKDKKEAIINSPILSDFFYYLLVWHFCSDKSSCKIEKIKLRHLRITYNNYSKDYQALLTLREKYPNTKYFLVRIFPHSD